MSLCTVCGDMMCDHTPEERGQTFEEMMRPLTKLERDLVGDVLTLRNQPIKKEVARRFAHHPPGGPPSE